jgi:hypothetical protein
MRPLWDIVSCSVVGVEDVSEVRTASIVRKKYHSEFADSSFITMTDSEWMNEDAFTT